MSKKNPEIHRSCLVCLVLLLLGYGLSGPIVSPICGAQRDLSAAERSQPREPSEALSAFELAPGVEIELVASEPEVVDPVSIRFDEEGRMWVVEMRDYPLGPPFPITFDEVNCELQLSKGPALQMKGLHGELRSATSLAGKGGELIGNISLQELNVQERLTCHRPAENQIADLYNR